MVCYQHVLLQPHVLRQTLVHCKYNIVTCTNGYSIDFMGMTKKFVINLNAKCQHELCAT